MWIARDEYGVSLHRTEPTLEPSEGNDDADPRAGDMVWRSEDSVLPDDHDDECLWLAAELGKDLPINTKARVRLVLAEPDMPLFGGTNAPRENPTP